MKVAQGILNLSATYRLWQAPFAAAKLAPFLARNDLQRARRVLDVGCGPGTNAHLFAHADYLGVDITPDYIAYARKKFRRPFVVADVSTYELRRTSASTSSCSTGSFTISRPRLCGASWRTCAHFSRPIKLFMRCGGMTDYERGWTQWGDMIRYSPAPFHRRRLILRLADEVPFESVIDVGCGNGELRAALSQHRPLRRLIGVDTAASIIDQNRRVFPGFEFHNMDIASACLPTKCDLVVCSEVIEHVVEWEQALVHLRRMCAGHLIVTVLAGTMFPIDRLMGHHRHFALDTLREALRRARFVPKRAWRWGFPFHTAYKYLINLAPGASVRRFSGGGYSATTRAIATLITWLFYLNSRHLGSQLVIRARALDGNAAR